jgi:hypothetical protein
LRDYPSCWILRDYPVPHPVPQKIFEKIPHPAKSDSPDSNENSIQNAKNPQHQKHFSGFGSPAFGRSSTASLQMGSITDFSGGGSMTFILIVFSADINFKVIWQLMGKMCEQLKNHNLLI